MATAEDKKKDEITLSPEDVQASAPAPQKNKSKMLILIVTPLLLLLIGAGLFLFFTDMGRHLRGQDAKETKVEKEISPETLTFLSVPELMVNLIPNGKKTPFLRLGIKLELENAEAQKAVELLLPRIIDQFQLYLRELRLEDIEGSAGIYRLKEQLLKRVNLVTKKTKVTDVLFEVMLVQ